MSIETPPEKIEELRKIISEAAPFIMEAYKALTENRPSTFTDALVNMLVHLGKSGLLD